MSVLAPTRPPKSSDAALTAADASCDVAAALAELTAARSEFDRVQQVAEAIARDDSGTRARFVSAVIAFDRVVEVLRAELVPTSIAAPSRPRRTKVAATAEPRAEVERPPEIADGAEISAPAPRTRAAGRQRRADKNRECDARLERFLNMVKDAGDTGVVVADRIRELGWNDPRGMSGLLARLLPLCRKLGLERDDVIVRRGVTAGGKFAAWLPGKRLAEFLESFCRSRDEGPSASATTDLPPRAPRRTARAPSCDLCAQGRARHCGDRQPVAPNYTCTRPIGHAGAHSACGGSEHEIASWRAAAPALPAQAPAAAAPSPASKREQQKARLAALRNPARALSKALAQKAKVPLRDLDDDERPGPKDRDDEPDECDDDAPELAGSDDGSDDDPADARFTEDG